MDSEGFEPPTSRVQGERSTNWAKSPGKRSAASGRGSPTARMQMRVPGFT